MGDNAQPATVSMFAGPGRVSQLDVLESQASPLDTGFLRADCAFTQFWELDALILRNLVCDPGFEVSANVVDVFNEGNCGVIPVPTPELERLAV